MSSEQQQWYTVRRTWYVKATSVTDALDQARPGEHDDAYVSLSPLDEAQPAALGQLPGSGTTKG